MPPPPWPARRLLPLGTVVWSVPHPLPAVPPSCRFVLGRGGRCPPLPSCIPHPWGGGGAWGGGGTSFSLRRSHVTGTRCGIPLRGGGGTPRGSRGRPFYPTPALPVVPPPGLARRVPSSGTVVRFVPPPLPPHPAALPSGGGVACRLPLFRTPRPRGGGDGWGGRCALFVSPPLHARRRQDVGTTRSRGEALGCCGGGGGSFRLGLAALLHGLGPAAQDNQPLLPLGGSRHVSAWCLVSRACSLLCPYLLEEVRTRVETEDEEVRAAGRTYCTPRRPPWSRGGPLFRHPTARGGPTAHPLPGACVSTSERPDTGAVVSVRWKRRLQSGRALSSPGPLPPPSAMEAPEVLWQRRGETDGGFICGIPWPPI